MEVASVPSKSIAQTELERTPGTVAVSLYRAGGQGSVYPWPCAIPALVGKQTLGAAGGEAPASPSLVDYGVTQQAQSYLKANNSAQEACPSGGFIAGRCKHGTTRWVRLSCKRRGCPVCGPRRRRAIAWRIGAGIAVLGQGQGGAWLVLTWARDVEKGTAVGDVGKLVRWLRKRLGSRVQYACTWEETRRGRLHCNLILAPWRYIPQAALSRAWVRFGGGKRVWVERVGAEVGVEAAKSKQEVGVYVSKLEQMVKRGRGVTYSKGWPKLPTGGALERRGVVTWRWVGADSDEGRVFEYELDMGQWLEVGPAEYYRPGERCDCFELVGQGP